MTVEEAMRECATLRRRIDQAMKIPDEMLQELDETWRGGDLIDRGSRSALFEIKHRLRETLMGGGK